MVFGMRLLRSGLLAGFLAGVPDEEACLSCGGIEEGT